jgi:SAM-dependent methyltransferase
MIAGPVKKSMMASLSDASFCGYPVTTRMVVVAGHTFHLLAPRNCEELLDDPRTMARFTADEYMPYWADLWPAAFLLAEEVAAWPPAAGASDPPGVLELGCGLGLVGLAVAWRGYPVIVTDYDEDALAFAAENARRNGLPPPLTRSIDWRQTYPDLALDRILAADVLYEARNLAPMANFIRQHLRPGGFALVADADRPTADPFERVARAAGLAVTVRAVQQPRANQPPLSGRIFRLWNP